MISFFPSIYPDELLYSQLARYYMKSGYMAYTFAAQDLYVNQAVRPDSEFLNTFKDTALEMITQYQSIENIIQKHTMFPYYAKFLPKERRTAAFNDLVSIKGNHRNLLAIPKRKDHTNRFLRFCPMCAENDRLKYGETFWHRIHQMIGINICPMHFCTLINSNLIIGSKESPALKTAEESVPYSNTVIISHNNIEHRVAEYVAEVFQSDMDMLSDVGAGTFMHSRIAGTKYRSVRGEHRHISLLHSDFCTYYTDLKYNDFTELWQIQKVFTNDSVNIFEICLLALFLDIPACDLTHMKLTEKTQEKLFDECIFSLREQGLSYVKIAKHLNASINVVKTIREGRYKTCGKVTKKPLKSGTKPRNWEKTDEDTLPLVKTAIQQLNGDGITRPKKVSIFAVEKMLRLSSKQLDNLPKCRAEVKKYTETQEEYWAKEVAWAVNTIIKDDQPFNWKHIRTLTNMRKENLKDCIPYLYKFADAALADKLVRLL